MRPLGDTAGLIDVADFREARRVASRLRADEVIPAATTVGVVGEVTHADGPDTADRIAHHDIPVVFDGADLGELGLSRSALEAEDWSLEVAWLGFMPGFAYLAGLPAGVASLARHRVARTSVPAGSFGVGGGYGGIYPSSSPGGWQLLGRTATRLFDPDVAPYALLQPGDSVRLHPVPELPEMAVEEPARPEGGDLEVVSARGIALVEDLGRRGAGALGVPRSGAADPLALRVANLAVGNDDGAAAIEVLGEVGLRASSRDLLVVVVPGPGHEAGTAARIGDSPVAVGTVTVLGSGHVLTVRAARRTVLAFGGGLDTTVRFASRSCDAVSGLPPGPLRPGDSLAIGPTPERARHRVRFRGVQLSPPGGPTRLRAIAGPDPVDTRSLEALASPGWVVGTNSDRTGIRLERPHTAASPQPPVEGSEVPSHAVVPGAIQVPPGGEPVILGPDCGPVGGYGVAATVVSADLWRLGALVPGDGVEIVLVTPSEAAAARERTEGAIASSVSAWFPTRIA